MEFVKSKRVVWRIEEFTAAEPSEDEKREGLVQARPVLCLIAQDLEVEDVITGTIRKVIMGQRTPTQKPVGSPGTPVTELLNQREAEELTALLDTALGRFRANAGILEAKPTIDDEIANVQAKLADAIARKQAAIDAAMLAEAEALAAAEAAKP